MTGLAKVTPFPMPGDPLIDRRTNKPRKVTPKTRKALRLLLEGVATTFTAAAGQVGMHPDSLSRALKQPHVKRYLDERTHALLDSGKTIAAGRLMQLINATSEHVSLDAAKLALGISGIKPAENAQSLVNVNISPGYIIDLTNPRDDLPRRYPHLVQQASMETTDEREED